MRQPTFSRRRRPSRAYRLTRTLIGLVTIVVLVAFIVGKLGGGGKPAAPTPVVAFKIAHQTGQTDAGSPGRADVAKQASEIARVLNDWFQTAFVDPRTFGDGTFPGVAKHFAEEARAKFAEQRATLTIGDARTEVARVVLQRTFADVAIFFEAGKTPRFATVHVDFRARATLKDKTSLPLLIAVEGNLHLERRGAWVVTFWDVNQTQKSIQPSPTPTTG